MTWRVRLTDFQPRHRHSLRRGLAIERRSARVTSNASAGFRVVATMPFFTFDLSVVGGPST